MLIGQMDGFVDFLDEFAESDRIIKEQMTGGSGCGTGFRQAFRRAPPLAFLEWIGLARHGLDGPWTGGVCTSPLLNERF